MYVKGTYFHKWQAFETFASTYFCKQQVFENFELLNFIPKEKRIRKR